MAKFTQNPIEESRFTALLSDIHGNTPALEAVLEDVHSQGCTRLLFLGDLINGLDPHGCLQTLLSWGPVECLQGNAEAYTFTPGLDQFPLRSEPFYQELLALLAWFRDRLTPAEQTLVSAWPEILWWERACLAHDSPLERLGKEARYDPSLPVQYQEIIYHGHGLTPDLSAFEIERLTTFMDQHNLEQVFGGHTHIPFVLPLDGKLICNVGSVGMPLDGDPRAAWALMETQAGGSSQVTIRRVAYDVERTLRLLDSTDDYPDFKRPGMKDAYSQMISTGIHWKAYMK